MFSFLIEHYKEMTVYNHLILSNLESITFQYRNFKGIPLTVWKKTEIFLTKGNKEVRFKETGKMSNHQPFVEAFLRCSIKCLTTL